jgi:hypothetical protein
MISAAAPADRQPVAECRRPHGTAVPGAADGSVKHETHRSAATKFANVEPPHTYVRDAAASVVHHHDYLTSRDDHALCGIEFTDPVTFGQLEQPSAVCPDCEAKLVQYHLAWWRDRALAATAELDALRAKYQDPARDVEDEPARSAASPRVEITEVGGKQAPDRGGRLAEERSSAEQADAKPTSLLDHARRELLELCRQFDTTVPYRRVKNTMQAFSDKLDADERVILAQQIGGEGSLIRWSTAEVENLGWEVADNPLQGEPEEMWDAWRATYQTPTQSKWRLGRSRPTGS